MLAPIILFAYNRPRLAKQTLASLKANALAKESELFIFSDGPKKDATPEQIEKINEVRKVIREEQWCGKVSIIEQAFNKGLAVSVIDGVSEIVEKYGKVIVVEDDVLLSPYFLHFMNESLELYADHEEVLSVGSWNYFCKPDLLKEDYFFFRYPDSIAWATYARAWKLFEKDPAVALKKLKKTRTLSKFNGDNEALYFEKMLQMQIEGKINSWAIRWTATAVLNKKTNIFPKETLSKHIGFGAEATHEKSETDYNAQLIPAQRKMNLVKESIPIENEIALENWKKFIKKNFITEEPKVKISLAKRIVAAIYRRIKKIK